MPDCLGCTASVRLKRSPPDAAGPCGILCAGERPGNSAHGFKGVAPTSEKVVVSYDHTLRGFMLPSAAVSRLHPRITREFELAQSDDGNDNHGSRVRSCAAHRAAVRELTLWYPTITV